MYFRLSICLHFAYKTYDRVLFEIFNLMSNAGEKGSLALMHIKTFILKIPNLKWRERNPLSVVAFTFSKGERFHRQTHTNTHTHTHTHTHTYTHKHTNIFVAFLETGNKNVHLIDLHQL